MMLAPVELFMVVIKYNIFAPAVLEDSENSKRLKNLYEDVYKN